MSAQNVALIKQFYESFAKLDHEKMNACYAEQVDFSDSVFKNLDGKKSRAMWHMLCSRAQNFELTFSDVRADEETGSCRWEAKYLFPATGRQVHNKIEARFWFKDGKIIKHRDAFPFYRWTQMALGPMGYLLGWSPLLQNKVRKTAAGNLEKFINKHPEYR